MLTTILYHIPDTMSRAKHHNIQIVSALFEHPNTTYCGFKIYLTSDGCKSSTRLSIILSISSSRSSAVSFRGFKSSFSMRVKILSTDTSYLAYKSDISKASLGGFAATSRRRSLVSYPRRFDLRAPCRMYSFQGLLYPW